MSDLRAFANRSCPRSFFGEVQLPDALSLMARHRTQWRIPAMSRLPGVSGIGLVATSLPICASMLD